MNIPREKTNKQGSGSSIPMQTQWINRVPPYVRKFHFVYEVVRTSTNVIGVLIVHQANSAGAFIVHQGNVKHFGSYIKSNEVHPRWQCEEDTTMYVNPCLKVMGPIFN